MKNIAMCLFLTALLSGCCGNAEMKRVAMGEPILPIHETGDTTEVFLTDQDAETISPAKCRWHAST
jgi:hypothetical protein